MQGTFPNVVTIGGGHGQSALLAALSKLYCKINAVVSVADDGGCSGQLRKELGMPPPGDLRRCLTALARDRALAEKFEWRLVEGRSAGNLAISAQFVKSRSLQSAVDWAADLLGCRGRVVPVAETPGVLVAYDANGGRVEGETQIEHLNATPMVAMVHGPTTPNPVAIEVIDDADIIMMGPGSFFTSTLATLTTANLAESIADSEAQLIFFSNLTPEGEQTAGFRLEDYIRVLRDHITIASVGGAKALSVVHHCKEGHSQTSLADGTRVFGSPLCHSDEGIHDPELVADALAHHFNFMVREPAQGPSSTAIFIGTNPLRHQVFEQELQQAERLLLKKES
jgi:uncharacterized cofD-like protein